MQISYRTWSACLAVLYTLTASPTFAQSATDSTTFVPFQEFWRKPGEARPLIYTNRALDVTGLDYPDLATFFGDHLAGHACISLEFRGQDIFATPAEIKAYVQQASDDLAQMFSGDEVMSLSVQGTGAPLAIAMPQGLRTDVPTHNPRPTLVSLIDEQAAVGAAGRMIATTSANAPAPSTNRSVVVVELLTGSLGRSCAVTLIGERAVIYLGEDLVLGGQTNYLLHALGNLAGLKPVWGGVAYEECDDDDIADTPIHSSPNYDCGPDHYSACTQAPESFGNVMDARLCEDALGLTDGQRAVLLPQLALLPGAHACHETTERSAQVEESCFFTLYPNPVGTASANGCKLSVHIADDFSSVPLSLSVSRSGVSVVSGYALGHGEAGGEVSLDWCALGLSPGSYVVTIASPSEVCSRTFAITQ